MSGVLFLDIDGVLNSDRSIIAFSDKPAKNIAEKNFNTIDPVAIALVNRLIDTFDLQVVITSTHRTYFKDCSNPLEDLKDYVSMIGLRWRMVSGYTDFDPGSRGEQIGRWLYNNPVVKNYVILDDVDSMLPEQAEHFVQIDSRVGFTVEDYKKAARILGSQQDINIYL